MVERDDRGKPFESHECPRSVASNDILELVQFIQEQIAMKELTGASMFPSPDVAKWPNWYYEAVMDIAARKRMREVAEQEAMAKAR